MLIYTLILTVSLLCATGWTSSHPNPSVIIVGSGPSGIAAATKLLRNGLTNLRILEAEDRIGGRIKSIKLGDGFIDLGAEFCHGEKDNIVYSMAKDLGVLQHSDLEFNFVRSNGEIVDKTTTKKIVTFEEALEADKHNKDNCENATSIGECLKIQSTLFPKAASNAKEAEILQEAYDWIKNSLSSLDSPFDLNDLNITSNYKLCEGDLSINWNGYGYKTILEIMMQKFPNKENQLPIDDKIFVQKEVVNVTNWKEPKVIVTTSDGTKYEVDHVIFTPSLGVLKASYEKLFSPRLPENKVKAIKNIGFGAILKIIMRFPKQWWSNNSSWPLIWTTEDKEKLKEANMEWLTGLTGIIRGENNRKVLISWFAGKNVPHIEALSQEELEQGVKHILTSFFSLHYNITMPEEIIRTTWYSNPHFRGTYSYESVKGYREAGNNLPAQLAKPLLKTDQTPSLLFAGEATHPYFFSTVHGAIESGYREADRLLTFYKKIN